MELSVAVAEVVTTDWDGVSTTDVDVLTSSPDVAVTAVLADVDTGNG